MAEPRGPGWVGDSLRNGRPRGAWLRLGALFCALLALTGVAVPLPTRSERLVLAFDVSDSITAPELERGRSQAISIVGSLAPGDLVSALVFASGASLLFKDSEPALAGRILESVELRGPTPSRTDLSAALALALSSEKGGGTSPTVALFTDGRANSGAALPIEALRRGGVRVFAFPLGVRDTGLASARLSLPPRAGEGDRVQLTYSAIPGSSSVATVTFSLDGKPVGAKAATASGAETGATLETEAGAPGARLVQARSLDAQGAIIPGSEATGIIEVGGRLQAIVAHGSAARSPISDALAVQGIGVRDIQAEELPESAAQFAGASALVLDDVSALALGAAQERALADFVTQGGGLLVVGGDSSLGRGEYYATPLEDLLPVSTDARQRLFFTRAKVLFLIDHSGSMTRRVGSVTKQEAAMQGVAASIADFGPQDEIGILTFDSSPTWVLPFTPSNRKAEIAAALSNIPDGGGTDMGAAIEEAIRGFGPPGPVRRHVVVITDGFTSSRDFASLASRLTVDGITLTTIGVGEDVNEALLKSIAARTGGSYFRATADLLPKVIEREAVRITRDLVQEGRFEARIATASPATEGLAGAPAIKGYLITKKKDLATVLLEARPEGAAVAGLSPAGLPQPGASAPSGLQPPGIPSPDPLLAVWRHGAGEVAVFTSDSGARWLSPWSGNLAYNRLWAQTLRLVSKAAPEPGLRASATLDGQEGHVTVEATGLDGRSRSGLRLKVRAASGVFDLVESAPGRYEAAVPLAGTGLLGFNIEEEPAGGGTSAWLWKPPAAEASGLGPDEESLGVLASGTGGGRITDRWTLPRPWRWDFLPIGTALVALSLAFAVLELWLRNASLGLIPKAREAWRIWRQASAKAASEIPRPWTDRLAWETIEERIDRPRRSGKRG